MTELDELLEKLRTDFGIVDEGNIVDDDDFETCLLIPESELHKERRE